MNDIGIIIALGVLCFDCTIIDYPQTHRDHEIIFELIFTTVAFGKKRLNVFQTLCL